MNTLHAGDLYPSRLGDGERVFSRLDPVVYMPEDNGDNGCQWLSPRQIHDFDQQGFLLIEGLLGADDVAQLATEAARLRADPMLQRRDETIVEPHGNDVRSIFDVQRFSTIFRSVMHDARIAGIVRYLLADDLYLHQSRLNYKPGFHGKEFYWHSDFETWHVEDGMPRMRAISVSVAITDNYTCNGPVMVIPGSHRQFVSCAGQTPGENYKTSLREQRYGVPSDDALRTLVAANGIREITGKAGSVLFFDCNLLHGSASNITPYPRSNLFFVYNAVSNLLQPPFCDQSPRPEYIAHRTQIESIKADA